MTAMLGILKAKGIPGFTSHLSLVVEVYPVDTPASTFARNVDGLYCCILELVDIEAAAPLPAQTPP